MAKNFDRLLDKATDSTLIDPNWEGIFDCVDVIRSGEAPLKQAVASIRKRYRNENPHVAHHALLVLEACMKNCGAKFHAEVATKDFMEEFKNLSIDSNADKVKNKMLELLQCWSIAFRNKPEYKIVVDTHNLMKFSGFDFPKVSEADAMFVAESAPEWVDGDECFRCRTSFGLLTRKHHCRACGQIFCDKCSGKQSYLPQYGIEKAVRVCDGCYEKTPLIKNKANVTETSSLLPAHQSAAVKVEKLSPAASKKTGEQRENDLKQAEEDELNLALAISQSEAEAKEQDRQRRLYQLYNGNDHAGSVSSVDSSRMNEASDTSIYKGAASLKENKAAVNSDSGIDANLARYLNRDYWQNRRMEQKCSINGNRVEPAIPTAPPPSESSHSRSTRNTDASEAVGSLGAVSVASTYKQLNGDATPTPQLSNTDDEQSAETMEFCRQLMEQVTVLDNRIRSNLARNRPIVNDTVIQSQVIRLTEMHAQVMARMNKLEDQRNFCESLQDHLAHIQEARQAVNALREDHLRQKQQRALEEQRMRQVQMQQKVDLMRQKKHESLLHQRHLALLRFQQQEHEMQMRRLQSQHGVPNSISYYSVDPHTGMGVPFADPTVIGQNMVQTSQQQAQMHYLAGSSYVHPQYGYVGNSQENSAHLMETITPQGEQQPDLAVQQKNSGVANISCAAIPSNPSSSAGVGIGIMQQYPYSTVPQQAQYVPPAPTSIPPTATTATSQQVVYHQSMPIQVTPQQHFVDPVQPRLLYGDVNCMQYQQEQYANYQAANPMGASCGVPINVPQQLTGQSQMVFQQQYPPTGEQVNQGTAQTLEYISQSVPVQTTSAPTAAPSSEQPAEGLLISFD